MSWMEFVSSMAGHLAWPTAVVVLAMLFRRQLAGLVSAVDSWEGFGQKFTFAKRLAKTEEAVDKVAGRLEVRAALVDPEYPPLSSRVVPGRTFQRTVQGAEANPSVTILETWESLVVSLRGLHRAIVGTDSGSGHRDVERVLRELRDADLEDAELFAVVRELRTLRDQVAHGQHRATPGEALAYADAGRRLRKSVDSLAFNIGLGEGEPSR